MPAPATGADTVAESPSVAVVEAVARAEGVEPTAIEVPLNDAVDPDALDALFSETATETGLVAFTYHGYDVVVYGDGRVEVEDIDVATGGGVDASPDALAED